MNYAGKVFASAWDLLQERGEGKPAEANTLEAVRSRAGRLRITASWQYVQTGVVFADEKNKFDEIVEEQGVKILVDPGALMHVVGTQMDFVEDRLK